MALRLLRSLNRTLLLPAATSLLLCLVALPWAQNAIVLKPVIDTTVYPLPPHTGHTYGVQKFLGFAYVWSDEDQSASALAQAESGALRSWGGQLTTAAYRDWMASYGRFGYVYKVVAVPMPMTRAEFAPTWPNVTNQYTANAIVRQEAAKIDSIYASEGNWDRVYYPTYRSSGNANAELGGRRINGATSALAHELGHTHGIHHRFTNKNSVPIETDRLETFSFSDSLHPFISTKPRAGFIDHYSAGRRIVTGWLLSHDPNGFSFAKPTRDGTFLLADYDSHIPTPGIHRALYLTRSDGYSMVFAQRGLWDSTQVTNKAGNPSEGLEFEEFASQQDDAKTGPGVLLVGDTIGDTISGWSLEVLREIPATATEPTCLEVALRNYNPPAITISYPGDGSVFDPGEQFDVTVELSGDWSRLSYVGSYVYFLTDFNLDRRQWGGAPITNNTATFNANSKSNKWTEGTHILYAQLSVSGDYGSSKLISQSVEIHIGAPSTGVRPIAQSAPRRRLLPVSSAGSRPLVIYQPNGRRIAGGMRLTHAQRASGVVILSGAASSALIRSTLNQGSLPPRGMFPESAR